MKNQELFKNFMAGLGEVFGKEISDILFDIYWNALKDFTDEQCKTAFNKAMVQCKFFPKPVEIIELIGGGPGKLEDVAQLQADLVVSAIRKIGSYQSVKFKDPVTTAVIQQSFGGWIKICLELMETSEKWFRKDFISAYQTYFRQGIKSSGHLSGLVETDNMTRGHLEFIPDPLMVDGVEILRIGLKD